jgi:ribosome-binding factor A
VRCNHGEPPILPMKTYTRVERVKPLLQQEISRILQMDIKDPRVKFVTVTDVKLSADLREAKVLVSSLSSTTSREELLTGLKRATGYIRGELGRRLTLKHIPQIEFVFDDSLDKQERIFTLLDQIHESEELTGE